jgi:hypothetical protein
MLFPPIQPTRTIHTPLRLLRNVLPAILALDLLLDDVVMARPAIETCNHEQAQRDEEEAHDLVEKVTPGPDDGAIVESLLHGVVTVAGIGAWAEDREALVEVARYEW